MQSLSSQERKRYSQQLLLPEIGSHGQQILRDARVLVVGLGGLGAPASMYLAAAGVGLLGLADGDSVMLSNLHRQVLYNQGDIGREKAAVATEKLKALNPDINIVGYSVNLDARNSEILIANHDFILDGTDNYRAHYLLNEACLKLKKPLVTGSVLKFKGRVLVVTPDEGPCYRCLFPDPELLSETDTCAGGGVLGTVPGTIGTLQATEILKLILQKGRSRSGKILDYDALEMRFTEFHLDRNPLCPLHQV